KKAIQIKERLSFICSALIQDSSMVLNLLFQITVQSDQIEEQTKEKKPSDPPKTQRHCKVRNLIGRLMHHHRYGIEDEIVAPGHNIGKNRVGEKGGENAGEGAHQPDKKGHQLVFHQQGENLLDHIQYQTDHKCGKEKPEQQHDGHFLCGMKQFSH